MFADLVLERAFVRGVGFQSVKTVSPCGVWAAPPPIVFRTAPAPTSLKIWEPAREHSGHLPFRGVASRPA